jgi:hypothetical protein
MSRKSQDNDSATRVLYEQLCSSSVHGPFIKRVQIPREGTLHLPATIAIVPGAFHEVHCDTGADGKTIAKEAQRLGTKAETIPLPNLGTLRENARRICNWLKQRDDTIVLVSLSKGSADVKIALTEPDAKAAFRNVVVWVNVSGILNGTPWVGHLFSGLLRSCWINLLAWARGYNVEAFRELDYRPSAPLDFPLTYPPHMKVIHVIGFPQRCHLSHPYSRRCNSRIAHFGPNDGAGILLTDVLKWPGFVYPVWGADHYLRPNDKTAPDVIPQVLTYLAEELKVKFDACTTSPSALLAASHK